MEKKYALSIAVLFLISVFLYVGICKLMGYPLLSLSANTHYSNPIISGHEKEPLPRIDILLSDSLTHIDLASQIGEKPIVLFYFSPYCPYCKSQLDEILKNMKRLKDIQFYLITPFLLSEMKVFIVDNGLYQHNNIIVGRDYEFLFAKYFDIQVVPYLAVYSKKGNLNAAFVGQMRFDQILSVSEQ